MEKKIVWLVVSCLMVLSLLMASCAPAVTEEEVVAPPEEEEVAPPEEEVATPPVEEEVAPSEEEVVTEEEAPPEAEEAALPSLEEEARPPAEEEVAPRTVPLTPDEVPRITIEELLQKIEGKSKILIVDTRQKVDYDKDHVKGAVSVPEHVITAGQWAPPDGTEIILYCA